MNNTVYFIRHAQTKVDENLPISKWPLTPEGSTKAKELASLGEFFGAQALYSSPEPKALQTAMPFAEKLNLGVQLVQDLRELERDAGGFMAKDAFEETVVQALTRRDISAHDWETADSALERFSGAIGSIEAVNEGKRIIIVGHGLTINLYFAKLLGKLDEVGERIKHNDFCDWGLIVNGNVRRDIAR